MTDATDALELVKTAAEIVYVSGLLYDQGHCRTGGNLSVRVSGAILITPTGLAADHLGRPPELCLVDMAGNLRAGPPCSRETAVHLELYAWSNRVGAVVHTHSPYTLAFSAQATIPAFTESARRYGRVLMCSRAVGDLTPLATAVSETVSRSVSLDDPAVAAYGICVLVPYHGLFVAAATLRRAVYFINKLEENAQLVLASTGLAFGSAK